MELLTSFPESPGNASRFQSCRMNTLQDRLRQLRGPASRRSFADRLGTTESTLRNYEQGKSSPNSEFLAEVVKVLRVEPKWLLTGQGSMYQNEELANIPVEEVPAPFTPAAPAQEADPWKSTHWQQVPVIGLAACGLDGWYNPSPLAMRLNLYVDYPYNPEFFAVIAVVTSMQPEGIRQGFVLYCDPAAKIDPDDAVYIEQKDGTAAVKKYVTTDGDWVYLQGWLPPSEEAESQQPFMDKLSRSVIRRMACVVIVKRKA